jgi:hypothetical protein
VLIRAYYRRSTNFLRRSLVGRLYGATHGWAPVRCAVVNARSWQRKRRRACALRRFAVSLKFTRLSLRRRRGGLAPRR